MPNRSVPPVPSGGAARPLDQVFHRFGLVGTGSSMYRHLAEAVGRSADAVRALESLPSRARQPAVVLAALHDLALVGRAPALAAAYADGDPDAAAAAAVDLLRRRVETVASVVGRLPLRPDETVRGAVLHPAIAEAAARLGASRCGLIDVGGSAGLNTLVDRVGITYRRGSADPGSRVGDAASPVQLRASVVGDRAVPTRPLPIVVSRIALDRRPVDLTDPEVARWWHACLPPDDPAGWARLDAELALLATDPPVLLAGDPVDRLAEAVDRIPADVLPVIMTTWSLSRVPTARRAQFLDRLEEVAVDRPLAWISVEGVGVAPSVPTLGDRPASGHSIVGVAVLGDVPVPAYAIGRCWSRGRLLAWLGAEWRNPTAVA